MMLQSNVNAQIEEKGRPPEIVEKWFEETLGPIFKGERKTLIFKGYYWWLQLHKAQVVLKTTDLLFDYTGCKKLLALKKIL